MKLKANFPTEKEGVNFIRSIVEKNHCIFHEISSDVDLGIDAHIELTRNGESTGTVIATQIKSGKSFFIKNKCKIYSDKEHFKYWANYSLPVIIIVYDPDEKCAYWNDITTHLEKNPEILDNGPYSISFDKLYFNRIDSKYFKKYFIPLFLDAGVPTDWNDSIIFAESKDEIESNHGFLSIYNFHLDKPKTWEFLIKYFQNPNTQTIPWFWIEVISSAFSHDFFKHYPKSEGEIRRIVERKLNTFTKKDILILLKIIDNDNYLSPDGENTIIIIGFIKNMQEILTEIVLDEKIPYEIRYHAVTTLGYHFHSKILTMFDSKIKEEFFNAFSESSYE